MFIIGITGGSGSGKSTLVKTLEKSSAQGLQVLSQDRYYHRQDHLTTEQRRRTNYDHPDAFDYSLLIAHLRALKAGDSIDVPVYDFVQETRKQETETIHPSKTLLLEGILLMNNDVIFNFINRYFIGTRYN